MKEKKNSSEKIRQFTWFKDFNNYYKALTYLATVKTGLKIEYEGQLCIVECLGRGGSRPSLCAMQITNTSQNGYKLV